MFTSINKQLVTILISLLGFYSQAQINFENGYFITNAGERVECLIKNMDWKNNPTQFEYKTSEDAESKTETIRTIREFGIIGKSKYQKHQISIDKSTEEISSLSTDRNPDFKIAVLFLKVLVEGKTNLYLYKDPTLKKFFYKTEDKPIEQLIYKSYEVSPGEMGKNTRYKQQLWNNLKCDKISLEKIEGLKYYKKQLVNLFIDYNTCRDPETKVTVFRKKKTKNNFNLTVRPRMNISSLKFEERSSTTKRVYDFGGKQNFSLGIEAEYILPFNKGKWGFFIEPSYQYFELDQEEVRIPNEFTSSIRIRTVEIESKSIEIPIGIRHYMFISNSSSIFINAAYVVDLALDSKVNIIENFTDVDIIRPTELGVKSKGNIAFGIGYNYKSKYSIELRHNTNKDLLSEFRNEKVKYSITSIILGYSIF
ncbi:tRNA modification GTPase [Aquimarina sp. 2304DJ70-9]|uniref:tRNA modification GTPase n=1 Tax=Aquimarina penaris TaxID=3231044 RepID=UPI003462C644